MPPALPLSTSRLLLERMLLIRAYEEKIIAFHEAGPFPHVCTSVGQEAAAAGVVSALAPQDQILTNHRSAGHLLARGADPGRMLAEVMGRSTGYCKGKSGTLHISAKELGVILTSTIVGGELSLATGAALSREMLGGDGIVACFFGDGAACEGIFHESLNLASIWNLPVLYVCENNQWQAYVHRKETMVGDHIAPRAAGYGIEALTVDGNDVEAVFEAATAAVAQVRATRRPFLLEATTYRQRGHMEPHDQSYVDPAEIAEWRAKDPIDRQKARLLAQGGLEEADLARLEARIRRDIDEAADFAAASPFPDPAELATEVYA
ncbi:acetoin:2,6-dichlorophenolindophenol oxidoreductase subunit alpha [Geothrix rubra]|uniref:Acetoin:2,6-dichlorophenolindophenol oxidoreductase subunit alpha n=1 Tax=Geothrix rubra TaxID=2927977 RepID=A0ABQ5Q8E8_9BACT|nr:thiamine pyrophosphate-dependent dehydrogenase E1 component subunit alpha [Geothrix rubra]GLH71092.1 acetoin:2,6-dichlorophenolindophenol oxidoreductase subunit alpha [Geothrix rubra]